MIYLTWLLRIVLIALLVAFVVMNDQRVSLRYFEYEWQAPLAVAVLISFVAGMLMGMLALSGRFFMQWHELSRLRRALKEKEVPPPAPMAIEQQQTQKLPPQP